MLQGRFDELQHEVDCIQADHARVSRSELNCAMFLVSAQFQDTPHLLLDTQLSFVFRESKNARFNVKDVCGQKHTPCKYSHDNLHGLHVLHVLQESSAASSHQQTLKQQAQRQEAVIQQLQQQLHAAFQQLGHLQQQAHLQATRAHKSAVAASAERLQELQERYFNSMPVDTLAAGSQSLLRLQRDSIVAAYNDFQQRRSSVQSTVGVSPNPFSSPSSTLRRGTWAGSSQGSLQLPWSQSSLADSPGRGFTASSRLIDSRQSFAAPVSRTSSSASPQKQGQGILEQPLVAVAEQGMLDMSSAAHMRQGSAEQPLRAAASQDVAERAASPQLLQHDASMGLQQTAPGSSTALPDLSLAIDSTAWTLSELQPESSWLLPFMQQMLQFEACLLNSLTALLTQKPPSSHQQDEQSAAEKKAKQRMPPRQQCWPQAAQESRQTSDDTTGEMRCWYLWCTPCSQLAQQLTSQEFLL